MIDPYDDVNIFSSDKPQEVVDEPKTERKPTDNETVVEPVTTPENKPFDLSSTYIYSNGPKPRWMRNVDRKRRGWTAPATPVGAKKFKQKLLDEAKRLDVDEDTHRVVSAIFDAQGTVAQKILSESSIPNKDQFYKLMDMTGAYRRSLPDYHMDTDTDFDGYRFDRSVPRKPRAPKKVTPGEDLFREEPTGVQKPKSRMYRNIEYTYTRRGLEDPLFSEKWGELGITGDKIPQVYDVVDKIWKDTIGGSKKGGNDGYGSIKGWTDYDKRKRMLNAYYRLGSIEDEDVRRGAQWLYADLCKTSLATTINNMLQNGNKNLELYHSIYNTVVGTTIGRDYEKDVRENGKEKNPKVIEFIKDILSTDMDGNEISLEDILKEGIDPTGQFIMKDKYKETLFKNFTERTERKLEELIPEEEKIQQEIKREKTKSSNEAAKRAKLAIRNEILNRYGDEKWTPETYNEERHLDAIYNSVVKSILDRTKVNLDTLKRQLPKVFSNGEARDGELYKLIKDMYDEFNSSGAGFWGLAGDESNGFQDRWELLGDTIRNGLEKRGVTFNAVKKPMITYRSIVSSPEIWQPAQFIQEMGTERTDDPYIEQREKFFDDAAKGKIDEKYEEEQEIPELKKVVEKRRKEEKKKSEFERMIEKGNIDNVKFKASSFNDFANVIQALPENVGSKLIHSIYTNIYQGMKLKFNWKFLWKNYKEAGTMPDEVKNASFDDFISYLYKLKGSL